MSPMPSLYIYIYVYMWYVLYHLSQVAVITPTDAGRRICETQLRRSLCSRVAKTAGMDSRNVLWKATYLAFDSYLHIWSYLDIAIRVSYPASKVLLCRVIGGNVNYTDEVTPDPEASFWGKYVFSMSTSKLHFTRPLCFAWWTCKHYITSLCLVQSCCWGAGIFLHRRAIWLGLWRSGENTRYV